MRGSSLDVQHHLRIVELHAVRAALVDVLLSITKFYALLGAIEEGRCADRITLGGEAVAHVTHVMVDPENLLDDHEALGGRGGPGRVCGKREAVRRLQVDRI